MRIAQITQDGYFPDVICGNATVNSNYHETFKKFLASPEDSILIRFNQDIEPHYIHKDLNVYTINADQARWTDRRAYNKNIADKMTQFLIDQKIDVVFFGDTDTPVFNFVCQQLPRHVLRIAVHHGVDNNFIRENHHLFDGSIVFTEFQLMKYIEGGLNPNTFLIAPPPLDFGTFSEPKPFEQRIPRSLLYMGRLKNYKGSHQLIPFLKDLNIEKYTIIGPRDLRDEPKYVDRVLTMAKNYDVEDIVDLRDPIGPDELIEFAQDYQIFVQTSRSEGISLVLREAMAAGCITVARQNDSEEGYAWARPFVQETPGYLSMANYIGFILDRPMEELQQISNSTYRHVKGIFDMDENAHNIKTFIEKLY